MPRNTELTTPQAEAVAELDTGLDRASPERWTHVKL